jgi:hypothetical protein
MHEALFSLFITAQIRRQEFERNLAFELGILGFSPRETTSLKSP